jgi:hypothetical protein
LRGSDISYNPVFFSYVVVSMDQVHLFVDEAKLTPAVHNHFSDEDLQVTIHPYEKLKSFLTDEVIQNKNYFIPFSVSRYIYIYIYIWWWQKLGRD